MAKIMLVEDDNNLREIYGARLMAEGYQIVSASDGEEALALAVKEKPDLIVSDVMMPKISGFDMLDILRTTPETKNTKVIIMTALSQPEDRQRGESLGADKYLVKSQVTLEDVVAAVHEILGDGPEGQTNINETLSSVIPQTETSNNIQTSTTPEPTTPETQYSSNNEQIPSESTDTILEQDQPIADETPALSNFDQNNEAIPTEPTVATSETEESQPTRQEAEVQPPSSDTSNASGEEIPKAEGANDAPEPASHKKKVIKPINDLSQQKVDLMRLVAQEENGVYLPQPNASPVSASVTQTSTLDNQSSANAIADGLNAEKNQLEAELKELVDSGAIDLEAAAPISTVNNSTQVEDPLSMVNNEEPQLNSSDINSEVNQPADPSSVVQQTLPPNGNNTVAKAENDNPKPESDKSQSDFDNIAL